MRASGGAGAAERRAPGAACARLTLADKTSVARSRATMLLSRAATICVAFAISAL